MKKVALTGVFGSGKTTVLGFFEESGLATIDADEIVDRLYLRPEIRQRIAAEFGTSNKRMLAKTVFFDEEKLKKLENILHPMVFEEIEEELKGLERQGAKVVVVDVPLLFESGFNSFFDKTVVVKASKQQILKRLQEKGLSVGEVEQRIESQMPSEEKIKLADYVIDNGLDLRKTKMQVEFLVKRLMANE